jgi:RimJ/RimL family protein N-acetyltransferase
MNAKRPERVTLQGSRVRIVPVDPAAHSPELYLGSHGEGHADLWRYLFTGPYPDEASFRAYLEERAKGEDPLFYTILRADGAPAGYASLMRIEPAHRVIEVGNILYLPSLQRTAGATEAMYLLARYVFDELGYRRYEWKCDALNAPSRRAAQRYGFTFEGVFRQHMIVKGKNRDTAWYSMLDSEWPERKAAFEAWLAAENFDAEGRQRSRLSDFSGRGSDR